MNCDKEAIMLVHKYFDSDLTKIEGISLRRHLESCVACQKHFHELKRTITWVQSAERIHAPEGFTESVMDKLPKEKRRVGYMRWFKAHPVVTAAAIFFVFMFSSVLSAWNQGNELVVSKQEDLIIAGDTVIVPDGVTVSGDLVVKNGNLRIDGTVDGNVTLIHGNLIDGPIDGKGLMASVDGVNGEFEEVDQIFEWMWYHLKEVFESIFSLGQIWVN